MDECPSHERIMLNSVPDWSRCMAVVCRNVCGVTRLDRKVEQVVAALVHDRLDALARHSPTRS